MQKNTMQTNHAHEALSSAPEKELPLQEIYAWFQKDTTKGIDQNQKGWQNSIRHKLSMNAVSDLYLYKGIDQVITAFFRASKSLRDIAREVKL